jgi:hypothetical protein
MTDTYKERATMAETIIAKTRKLKLCEKCGENPASVPDRNRMGRPIKRICFGCHSAMLAGDMQRIVDRLRAALPPSPESKP